MPLANRFKAKTSLQKQFFVHHAGEWIIGRGGDGWSYDIEGYGGRFDESSLILSVKPTSSSPIRGARLLHRERWRSVLYRRSAVAWPTATILSVRCCSGKAIKEKDRADIVAISYGYAAAECQGRGRGYGC